ncbi:MAG: Lrp/AsnC family transcriptional regulator [Deltaproteobacteria bacterium]|nr:Lrp/AsnC family transcriptional regulator [Deltaproteobacteria bacterium]MBZ0220266.1 Lrp/AsnC family transcriptional regulator [Deltaproteobacteria bacterium]
MIRDPRDIALIRVLQDEGLFLTARPFHEAALRLGWSVEEVLERSASLLECGVIRRFGAALTPRNAGFRNNAMVVWDIDDKGADEAGSALAGHPRVSHCYIRPRFEGFPFNVYTMVHGNSREDLEAVIVGLAEKAGASRQKSLHTVREFKKSSPVYFINYRAEPAGSSTA